MATAAFRQTTTVAHSPSDCLHDVIDEVWVVALAVDMGRFFHVLSTVLYILCRADGVSDGWRARARVRRSFRALSIRSRSQGLDRCRQWYHAGTSHRQRSTGFGCIDHRVRYRRRNNRQRISHRALYSELLSSGPNSRQRAVARRILQRVCKVRTLPSPRVR